MEIKGLIQSQNKYFSTGETLPTSFRIAMLRKLYDAILTYEHEISAALKEDLGKSEFESYMCEIGMTLSEITYMLKHIKKFSKDKRVFTPLAQFMSRSYVKPCPYGTVLIVSPWNYPFLLSIEPLVNAIAAGNTAILKPSAYSPATADVVEMLIKETFPSEYVAVVKGGREENKTLFQQKFDLIFFTGSQAVGREVLRHAAEHLTPTVLELGGKSPCIVDETADIHLTARRIVFGKFINCGQTCVAPDYVLCHSSVKDDLRTQLISEIKRQLGEHPLENPNYGKIINEKHFHRACHLIDPKKVVFGGNNNPEALQIEPTLLDNVTWADPIMQQEIFAPLLPILTFDHEREIYEQLEGKHKPLALYVFSKNKKRIHGLTSGLRYGGGCVNDTIIHLATSNMPFGGVGESGMGAYHGKTGFDAFTHYKAIVDKKLCVDLSMRYQPYDEKNLKLVRRFER